MSSTNKRLVSIEIEDQVCEMYQNNSLITQISGALKIERHTVVRVLKRRNLYNPQKSKRHLDQARIIRNQEVINLTEQGFTTRQIAKKLGVGKSNVGYILKNNENFVPKSIGRQDYRAKYSYNERFFQVIDTEEKAYWLGFLYADGCVTDDSVRVELSLKDRSHLEKFRDIIQYNAANFYFRKDVQSILLHIDSKIMVQDLGSLGCIQRKTFYLQFPTKEQVPESLMNHFMRGYFDGDGCIYVHSVLRSSFQLMGTIQFLERYQEELNKGISKNTSVKIASKYNNGIGELVLGGNQQVKKIYQFLYKDATVYLERKKEKFNIMISRLKLKDTKET